MKIIQLIFRILLSPLIFLISLGAMVLFPGTMALLLGGILIIGKLLGIKIEEDWESLIVISTIIIWFPIVNTYTWITKAKFIE